MSRIADQLRAAEVSDHDARILACVPATNESTWFIAEAFRARYGDIHTRTIGRALGRLARAGKVVRVRRNGDNEWRLA